MMTLHPYNPNGVCDHCHKSDPKGGGAFEVTANRKPLALCYRCLANLSGLMADPRDETPTLNFEPVGNHR